MKIGPSPIDRLIRTLQGQRTVYAALLSLYQNSLGDIKEQNLVALKPMLFEEQRLMRELNLYEQRRLQAVSRLAVSLGVEPLEAKRHLSHKEILALLEQSLVTAPDPVMTQQRQQLEQLGKEIGEAMEKLTAAREPLLPLLQNAINYIERNDPERATGAAPYETPGGRRRPPATRNLPIIDKKV